jgi:hypothetical protein
MRFSLFLVAMVLFSLASCATGEGVNGDPEGMYSLAVQGHIISSSDAIQLMEDNTGRFLYDQRLIAHYRNREPIHSSTLREYFLIDAKKRNFVSSEDMAHVLQLMNDLVPIPVELTSNPI